LSDEEAEIAGSLLDKVKYYNGPYPPGEPLLQPWITEKVVKEAARIAAERLRSSTEGRA